MDKDKVRGRRKLFLCDTCFHVKDFQDEVAEVRHGAHDCDYCGLTVMVDHEPYHIAYSTMQAPVDFDHIVLILTSLGRFSKVYTIVAGKTGAYGIWLN